MKDKLENLFGIREFNIETVLLRNSLFQINQEVPFSPKIISLICHIIWRSFLKKKVISCRVKNLSFADFWPLKLNLFESINFFIETKEYFCKFEFYFFQVNKIKMNVSDHKVLDLTSLWEQTCAQT
jgi:hypothetical protein